MRKGKAICEFLKSIRRKIAKINGISYDSHECHHKGDCIGTCPACDAELSSLSDEIDRLRFSDIDVNYDVLSDEDKKKISKKARILDDYEMDRWDDSLAGYPY